jgi:hypothetical protein
MVEREEGGRRCSDAVEMEDRGGRGEAESAVLGSSVERSEDGTQRKANGSTGSAVECEYRGCGDKKKLCNEARRKRNVFILNFRWTVRSRPG